MNNNQKWVWCTYVSTKDYIIPALTLGEQLKRVNSKYPLVIAMINPIYTYYRDLIVKMGCIPEYINEVRYHKELQEGFLKNHRLLNTSSRVSVFELRQYDKMVFIDADVLITRNVDELFNYFDGSMCSGTDSGEKGGFEGLLVCRPKNHSYGIYPYLIEHVPMMTSELFSLLWFPIKDNSDYLIPKEYFFDFGNYYRNWKNKIDIKIYHWAANKPWDLTSDNELYDTEEVQSYMKMYNEVKNKANSFLT